MSPGDAVIVRKRRGLHGLARVASIRDQRVGIRMVRMVRMVRLDDGREIPESFAHPVAATVGPPPLRRDHAGEGDRGVPDLLEVMLPCAGAAGDALDRGEQAAHPQDEQHEQGRVHCEAEEREYDRDGLRHAPVRVAPQTPLARPEVEACGPRERDP